MRYRTLHTSLRMRPQLEVLEDRLTPTVLNTATPLMNQALAPGATSFLDLSGNFIDSATTNGTMVTFNTSQGSFNVTLFDKDAPQTVTNFLDYIQAGLYNSDVFHRLSNLSQVVPINPPPTPFQVLQGGGFDATADASNNVTGFNNVSAFQPIQNESNDTLHPNAPGTLSMARTSGPNSATSQFFFNLTDNTQALAGSNGTGFAVFGVVTNSTGTTALQNFATNYSPNDVTTATGNSNFFAFPLLNGFTPASNFPTGATTADLALINSITLVSPPTGHLTYSILSNSNPSIVTATLGSNTVGSPISANQVRLVAGNGPGSSVITLQITDSQGASVTRQFTVTVAATTTTVTANVNPSVFGQAVTFTATVAAVSSGAGTPTGTVTFMDGTTTLGTGALNGGGQTTFTTSALSTASHSITAVYGGDTNFTTSTSAVFTQVVNRAATSTAVTANINPSVFGQAVTFTATVAATAPGAGTPTGTVTFMDGTTTLGTGALNGSDQATFSTSSLPAGAHSITAVYGGDTNFATSTSAALTQTANPASTATTVNASPTSTVFGQSVTFTATVAATAPGAGTPTGTVTFLDGATALGTGTLSNGSATFTTTALTAGTHSITARYSGVANFSASTSATAATVTVGQASTTLALTSSPNPSTSGQTVTFTATVAATAPGSGTPSGTVTFAEGATTLGTGSLTNGTATFATSALSAGRHTITASFAGNTSFIASSGTATQTVNSSATSVNTTLFVQQVYRDLLNREADPGGLAFFVGVANFSLMNVVIGIEQSPEFHMDEVQFLYEKLLRRAAEPTGLAGWTGFLNSGGTFRQLDAFILGSDEYFARFGGSSNNGFVSQLFQDVLGRTPDPGGLNTWTTAANSLNGQNPADFDHGLPLFGSRARVAYAILIEPESVTDEVESYYMQYFGRTADPGGLAIYVNDLLAGATEELVVATIVGSQEYALRASAGLGSPVNPNFYTPGHLAAGAAGAPTPAGFLFP